jgi:hypothetical protein
LLEQILSPITYSQMASLRAMGLRQRILNLPAMMAFVLSLIWRHVGSVTDAIRELNQRGILWARPTVVSQQAVSERLRSFPPELFGKVLMDIMVASGRSLANRFGHTIGQQNTCVISKPGKFIAPDFRLG